MQADSRAYMGHEDGTYHAARMYQRAHDLTKARAPLRLVPNNSSSMHAQCLKNARCYACKAPRVASKAATSGEAVLPIW